MEERSHDTPTRVEFAGLDPWCWRLLGRFDELTARSDGDGSVRTSHRELREYIIEQRNEEPPSRPPQDDSRPEGSVAE